MKHLLSLQRFFESEEIGLTDFDRFILYSCLGFMTVEKNKDLNTSLLPQFRKGGSANQQTIDTIQNVLKGGKITEEQIEVIDPLVDYILQLYDKQEQDAHKSLELMVYLNDCKKTFGYESKIKPDISDEEKYPVSDKGRGPFDLFRSKKKRYKSDLFGKMKKFND
jgi:hypothetical protein